MSLFVVYVPDTGHVVGALNATGAALSAGAALPGGVALSAGAALPGGAALSAGVGSLVGDALPMRVSLSNGEVAELALRAGQLAVLAADDEPAVFADPLAFGVELVPNAPPKPALLRLATWSSNELTLTSDGLVVKVPVANQSRISKVLALISDGQDTLVLTGEIPAQQDTVTLPVTVRSGVHGALVLVAGWAGRLEAVPTS